VRFVRAARHATATQSIAQRLADDDFDPDREIILHDAPATIRPTVDEIAARPPPAAPARAVVLRENSRRIVIEVDAPEDGFLLLADTFYPGWTATVGRVPTPIYRANEAVRGIQLPRGRHVVRFRYPAPAYKRGLWISVAAALVLVLWAVGAAYRERRFSRA
jgi:uncharacterized membrane protein YfhO